MNIGTLMATLGVNTAPLKRNLAGATRMFRTFSSAVMKPIRLVRMSLNKLRGAFLGLKTMIAGTLLLMAGRAFIKFGMNFERTMSIVQVVSEATAKQIAALREQVKELGITTEFTATQAGEALKFLAMAGLSVEQAMAALPQTLNLATAGNIDLARAADISTNIMSQMSLEAKDLTMVNDALVAVQATANTNIEEAAQAFIYAGAKARVFGADVAQLSALIGMLANNGIKATMAGTTLRQAMIKMIKPTSDGLKIFKKYNIEVQNADGSLRDFVTVLKEMADANLNAVEIVSLFGARAANIELILKSGSKAIEEYTSKVKSMTGVSQVAADTLRRDVMGRFKELQSALQGVFLSMWDVYKDKIKNSMIAATKWVRENNDEIIKIVRQTEQFLKDVIFEPGFAAKLIPDIGDVLFDSLVSGMQAFLMMKTAMWDVFLDPLVGIMLAKLKMATQLVPKAAAEWAIEVPLRAGLWSMERDLKKAQARAAQVTEKFGVGSEEAKRAEMLAGKEKKDVDLARERLEDFQKRSAQRMADYERQLRKEYRWDLREAMELDPAKIEEAKRTIPRVKREILEPLAERTREKLGPYFKEPEAIPSYAQAALGKEHAAEREMLAGAKARAAAMATQFEEFKKWGDPRLFPSIERRLSRTREMAERVAKDVGRQAEEMNTLIAKEKELEAVRKKQADWIEKIVQEREQLAEYTRFGDPRAAESTTRIAEMERVEKSRAERITELKQTIDNSVKVEINIDQFSGTEDNQAELVEVATEIAEKVSREKEQRAARNTSSIMQSQGV